MMNTFALSVAAVVALCPAAILSYRQRPTRDAVFWLLLAVAAAGPMLWIWVVFAPGWRTGLSAALWITVAGSLVLFAALSLFMREVWRLTPLLLPYLLVLGTLATVWERRPEPALAANAPSGWLQVHIALSVATYALLTIGAIAGLAVMLQERALKKKRPTLLTGILPSVADAECLQVRLLIGGAVILACDLISGMAVQYLETGSLLAFNHKVLFSLMTFAVILVLLLVHTLTGLRGRQAARLVLVAYLLLTLAYPGVKFVTDILLS